MSALVYTGTLYSASQPASGAVPLAFFLFMLTHVVMGALVGGARRKYGIPYPTMYAVAGTPRHYSAAMRPLAKRGASEAALPQEALISGEEAFAFNSVQRGHQNFVENSPFVGLALIGAWPFPIIAAAAATLHLAGRVLYFAGYSLTPDKRVWGAALMYPGLLTLLGLDIAAAVYAFQGKAPF